MEKAKKIYKVVLSIYALALGIATTAITWAMYFDGGDKKWFTLERFNQFFLPIYIMLGVLALAFIGGIILFSFGKAENSSVRDENLYLKFVKESPKLLKATDETKKAIAKPRLGLLVTTGVATLIMTACCVFVALYFVNNPLSNTANATTQTVKVLAHISPFIVVAIADIIAFKLVFERFARQLLSVLKEAPKGTEEMKPFFDKKMIWIIRGIVFAVAVTFLVVGIVGEGFDDVLGKAAKICLECVGIG